MAHLISFDPGKELEFRDRFIDRQATEKELFEAFWIGFKGGDFPRFGKEVKLSTLIENEIIEKSVAGGSIRMAHCPLCTLRQAEHVEIRTITEGFDLIVENEAFEYLKGCFERWQRTWPELKPYFLELAERFENSTARRREQWKDFIEKRGNVGTL